MAQGRGQTLEQNFVTLFFLFAGYNRSGSAQHVQVMSSENKKARTTSNTTCKPNWFFTSLECIPKWHRLIGNRWFIEALNEKLSYANGESAKEKFLSLLTFHNPGNAHKNPLNSVQLRSLQMPELDTAHMFVQVIRNERHVLPRHQYLEPWSILGARSGTNSSSFSARCL